jgi:release factor glutamine methyltransferase
VAVAAAEKDAEVTATDINPEALEAAGKRVQERGVADRVEFIKSDLFKKVKGRFDYILFNPPYLPGEDTTRIWGGGDRGIEITERFLENAPDYLTENGEILFIASSHANIDQLKQRFELEELDSQELWFETLYLFRSA